MQWLSLALLLTLVSCAHKTYGPKAFDKNVVCSSASLAFFNDKEKEPPFADSTSPEEVREVLLTIQPMVRTCFNQELKTSESGDPMNLCLVSGHDIDGKITFFEFSNAEVQISAKMQQCLSDIQKADALKTIKNVKILQPFRLSVVK